MTFLIKPNSDQEEEESEKEEERTQRTISKRESTVQDKKKNQVTQKEKENATHVNIKRVAERQKNELWKVMTDRKNCSPVAERGSPSVRCDSKRPPSGALCPTCVETNLDVEATRRKYAFGVSGAL